MTIAPDPFMLAADLFDPPVDEGSRREASQAADRDQDRAECAASSAVFIERHGTLEDPDGKVLPFNLWPIQRETLAALEDDTGVIVLKARRLGLSWVVLGFALWLAIFSQGIRILVLCKNEDDASELLDRIRRMRDRMRAAPESAHILDALDRPAKSRDALTTLDIGRSTIKALVGTPHAARSETAGFVILDEFAFQRGASEIWQSVLPTMEGGGRLAVVSTGNGSEKSKRLGAEFAKQWRRARGGLSGFTALFHDWHARPGRDDAWYEATAAKLGDPMKMRIEYPSTEDDAFLVADADLIYPGSHLDAAAKLGAALNESEGKRAPVGLLGIDWGVRTHMVAAAETPSAGLRLMAEYFSDRADIQIDALRCAQMLDGLGMRQVRLRYDPGAAGAKVIGTFVRLLKEAAPWLQIDITESAVPFSKFKVVAIQYAQLLARRAADGEALRVLAAAEADVPELLRQMRAAEWKDADVGRTEKGDDHGADAVLTLTAGPGFRWSSASAEPVSESQF